MKSSAGKRLNLVAAACTLAAVCGCQSSLFKKSDGMSKRESAAFQKKVSTDPFPTAQQSGFMGP
jgi:hypothetical protein